MNRLFYSSKAVPNWLNSSKQESFLPWIDILKGIGIICVVYGHAYANHLSKFIYLFHMPLFFFISGYLHKSNPDYISYGKKKVKHLLIPYFCFLTLILPLYEIFDHKDTVYKAIFIYFYGGTFLSEWLTVFWFTTCLFITQQLFNYFTVKIEIKKLFILVLFMLLLAYINSFLLKQTSFSWLNRFPWAANITLYALPIYYCGYLYKKRIECFIYKLYKQTRLIFIIFSFVIVLGLYLTNSHIFIDMKNLEYGIPFISFICSLIIVHTLIYFCKCMCVDNSFVIRGVNATLAKIGKASMIIMYLHSPILILLKYYFIPLYICLILSILISMLFYYVFSLNSKISKIFLGK
jgi:fucose 4-O-acetylase-like acetyltransferase